MDSLILVIDHWDALGRHPVILMLHLDQNKVPHATIWILVQASLQ